MSVTIREMLEMNKDELGSCLERISESWIGQATQLNEMAKILPNITGLPIAIWADEGDRITQHGPRLKFDPNDGNSDTDSWPSITFSSSPVITGTHSHSSGSINALVAFMIKAEKYRQELIKSGKKDARFGLTKKEILVFLEKKKQGLF